MRPVIRSIIFGQSLDPDARAYINAVELADGQPLESTVKVAINDFVVGCKQDGNWNAIASSCILAGARTLVGALVPLKGTAPTNFNFVSSDYNRKTGLIGNGSTKYLNSNRADNADPLNDCHISAFVSQAGITSLETYIGTIYGSPPYSGRIIQLADGYTGVANRSGMYYIIGAITNFMGCSRNNSSSYNARINSADTTINQASGFAVSANIPVFAVNFAGISRYSTARLSFYSIGKSVNLALLDARVTTLINRLGAIL